VRVEVHHDLWEIAVAVEDILSGVVPYLRQPLEGLQGKAVLAEPNASVANEDMQFGNIQLHLGKHFDLGLICCVFDPINFVLVEPLL
jgi:hypothetical protein